ncbi:coatomer epsilon subunit-domain-containing protein [Rhodocollybia butyracea]|uniref:Coatomer epsilon subunit-domain-containing protein n=1 Tax=Rhodocollybia butyracea TaxID=206335 RepID=A0A9P5Q590_9AGAR|nr:coatomer epsilon subunit-domain-containing protein [Rhodocollybia butyracea]
MDSSELYHVKQQFVLVNPNSPDFIPTLVYQARSYIALNKSKAALQLIPSGSENVALKAVAALAKFVAAEETAEKEATLEELRGPFLAGELEEALETLGADTEDLEAVSVIVQIYLSINRPDLAKKEFERSKRWAEDDLLLQLIESLIGLVTGKDEYHNPYTFYTEQLGNPSLSSTHVLTARGVTRILRNEFHKEDSEALAASAVASGLSSTKKGETEANELWIRMTAEYPKHPSVIDIAKKSQLFDEAMAKYTVPPLASTAAA